MKAIPLTQGLATFVDDDDYEKVKSFKWHLTENGRVRYARRQWRENGVCFKIYLHRLLLDAPKGMEVDHIDGDGLNNRRCNLRLCTHAQQAQAFQGKRLEKTSKYRGVSWVTRDKRWTVHLQHNQQQIYLGYFTNEVLAAHVHDVAAVELFGEFAQLNFL
jgi:hypothetical protein